MASWASKSGRRKLVSARCISRIKPLSSSKTHEVVMIEGWPVVVPKGKFAVNELILYFEIDSFLPFHDKRYESYRPSHTYAELHGERGWVVQTVILAGHISQGMVFRIDDRFPEVIRMKKRISLRWNYDDISLADHEDVGLSFVELALMKKDLTDLLGVERWATFHTVDGGVDLGQPPSFLPNSKLERAQNLPNLLETHGGIEFEITELLDGMPITVYRVNEDGPEYLKLPGMLVDDRLFRKRSGLGISIGDHDYGETEESRSWAAVRGQRIINLLEEFLHCPQLVLAGVLCGVGLSGNSHDISGGQLHVYSISDACNMRQFTMEEAEECRMKLRGTFQLVPTICRRIRLSAFAQSIDELMMKAEGGSFVFNDERQPSKRKGLVFRAVDGSLNFKAISNEWLLDETKTLREMDQDKRRRPGPNDCV